jgi:hypothetical protein
VAFAQRQRQPFPSADVHVLASSGHWPFVDSPETVERLLLEFLGQVRASSPSAYPMTSNATRAAPGRAEVAVAFPDLA